MIVFINYAPSGNKYAVVIVMSLVVLTDGAVEQA